MHFSTARTSPFAWTSEKKVATKFAALAVTFLATQKKIIRFEQVVQVDALLAI